MATQMESKGDEASYQHPKLSIPTNSVQFPSTSMPDSILPFPTLPPEIITDIFSRLPVKSLLQIRSVSKSCLAFISSPDFIKAHLSLSADNKDYTHHKLMLRFYQPKNNLKDCCVTSLLYESVLKASDLDYPMKDQSKTFWIVVGSSVNGLVCLSNGAKQLCLWNPSIRKHKKLPHLKTILNDANRFIYGFGYDEFHDDYKVVACIYCYGSSPSVEVNIYSLKDDSWKSIDYHRDWVRFFDWGKFVNGKIHWANNTGPFLYKGWNIISFDLADEKWEKVEQPCYGEEDGVLVLGVLGNNLSVICNGYHQRTDLDVWVMKEYGVKESWTKMFTFKCLHSPVALLFNPPFLISNKGEILLMFGQTFLLYNMKDESIRYPKFDKFASGLVAAIYLESLVSPLLLNEPRTQQE